MNPCVRLAQRASSRCSSSNDAIQSASRPRRSPATEARHFLDDLLILGHFPFCTVAKAAPFLKTGEACGLGFLLLQSCSTVEGAQKTRILQSLTTPNFTAMRSDLLQRIQTLFIMRIWRHPQGCAPTSNRFAFDQEIFASSAKLGRSKSTKTTTNSNSAQSRGTPVQRAGGPIQGPRKGMASAHC